MNYLIYGNSYHYINAQIKKIVKGQTHIKYYLKNDSLENILNDIRYPSLFGFDNIMVIYEFDTLFESKKSNEEVLTKLIEYLKNPDETVTLIFIASKVITNRSKINKELLELLKIINTPIITKEYELSKVLGVIINKNGYKISSEVLDTYAQKCACNLDVAINEFKKLKGFKKDRVITSLDVENYVSNYNAQDVFGLKDAILSKDVKKAIRMIEDAETAKMEPVSIVITIAKEYQTLYNIKALAEQRYSNDEISRKLNNMHPYRVKLLRELSNKYSEKSLIQIIKYLCDLNLKMVTSDNMGFLELKTFVFLYLS